jgi:hypothetical protein
VYKLDFYSPKIIFMMLEKKGLRELEKKFWVNENQKAIIDDANPLKIKRKGKKGKKRRFRSLP